MKMKFYITVFFLLVVICRVSADEYYPRHYIILVDQTKDLQVDDRVAFEKVYSYIKANFMGDGDSAFVFNKMTDEISLYTFALPGAYVKPYSYDYDSYYKYNERFIGTYGDIHRIASSGQSSAAYKLFVNKLIQNNCEYSAARKNGQSLENFLETNLYPLFVGKSKHYSEIDHLVPPTAVTFSKYVYPVILEKEHFNFTIPASEYIIIIASNFQSGLDDIGTSQDRNTLMEMLAEKTSASKPNLHFFEERFKMLSDPFYQIPLFRREFSSSRPNKNAQPTALGYKLGLKSLQGVTTYITSNLNLQQQEVGSRDFSLSPVSIIFSRDENLEVNKICLTVTNNQNDELYYREITDIDTINSYFAHHEKKYEFPAQKISLNEEVTSKETISFRYVFFTTAKDSEGNDIMPLVYIAERATNITEAMVPNNSLLATIVCAIIFLILAALMAYYIWKRRGASRKARELDFRIWPISHDRFVEVKEKCVSRYDCWYWREGDTSMDIPVSGRLILEKKIFAQQLNYQIEARIEDIDDNLDFSFRPLIGTGRDSHGNDQQKEEWYEVPMNSDGTFSFAVKAYKEPMVIMPDFERENILRLKVSVRCHVHGANKYFYLGNPVEHSYFFTVRPEINNRNLWIAFDPGTTGSCVAYGVSANPTDRDDIYLAENEQESLENKTEKTNIFPSKIRFNHKSTRLFDVNSKAEDMQEGNEDSKDFLFGNDAEQNWDPDGVNCFQSIKKLLGYTDAYTIIHESGATKETTGQDIAHLLIKGLYNHVEKYLLENVNVRPSTREMFMRNGIFTPQRAIVAVPNNYTMVKIQEMVDTVKRTNKFKEVHFIYEAEAVMMMYFRENWQDLYNQQNKIFVVYDMGGATINATAFKIRVTMGQKNGNSFIREIEVDTISKIGYGVGGDDIDFALIKIILDIPSVKKYLSDHQKDVNKYQQQQKVRLIEIVFELKKELIAKASGDNLGVSHVNDVNNLFIFIREKLKDAEIIIAESTEEDRAYLESIIDIEKLKKNEYLKKYIYSNVEDAVKNLFSSIKSKGDVELVMSGRSVLFPGISQLVVKTINEKGFACNSWSGFLNERGIFSSEKLKEAVATGACWYAMYSDYIKLVNDRVTSSFGYIDMIKNKQCFVPVIERNNRFNDEHYIELSSETKSELKDVKFVQMLGNADEYDNVLSMDIKHKYNVLDEMRPAEIRTCAEKIYIKVDDCANFSYKIKVQGKSECLSVKDNPFSRLSKNAIKTEIVNENSESYIFSTLQYCDSNDDILNRFLKRVQEQKKNRNNIYKKGSNRF